MWPFGKAAPIEAKSLTVPELWELGLFGAAPTITGALVSATTALAVPTVQSAIRVVSEAAATLNLRVVTIEGGKATDAPDHPAWKVLQHPNGWTGKFELIRDLVADALTNDLGAMAWLNRVNGEPVEIIRYRPGVVQVSIANTGEPSFKIDNVDRDRSEVIHLRGPFDRCALTLAREAIGVAMVMEKHAARLFGSGAKPGGVIEMPKSIGDEGVKKMLKGWKAAMEGADNAGKTAVLWDGAKWVQMTLTSVDAQFLELRKFQILEIANAFRVPPGMLYQLDRATWSNSEQMGREFLVYTLEPWLEALEGALGRALFTEEERPRMAVRFDRDDLTRADFTTRFTGYSSGIAARIINPNEARRWEGLPPYEGGDQFANPNTGSNQPGAAAPQGGSSAA